MSQFMWQGFQLWDGYRDEDDGTWGEAMTATLKRVFTTPGGAAWWERRSAGFVSAYVQVVKQIIEASREQSDDTWQVDESTLLACHLMSDPGQDNQQRQYRNESPCAGLQHEASHEPRWSKETHRSDLTSSLASRKVRQRQSSPASVFTQRRQRAGVQQSLCLGIGRVAFSSSSMQLIDPLCGIQLHR
jgi:hypothetical protein